MTLGSGRVPAALTPETCAFEMSRRILVVGKIDDTTEVFLSIHTSKNIGVLSKK